MEEEGAFVSSSFLMSKVIEYKRDKKEMRNGYAPNQWNYRDRFTWMYI